MEAYKAKYLFCVTFDDTTGRSLDMLSADMRSIVGGRRKTTLPYHVTLAPPFVVAADFRERMLLATQKALEKTLRPYIFTTQLELLPDADGVAGTIVLGVRKTEILDKTHRSLLSILETYRQSGDNELTPSEKRFGSRFVLYDYHPHISLCTLEQSRFANAQSIVGSTHVRSYRDTKITLLEKVKDWRVIATFPNFK